MTTYRSLLTILYGLMTIWIGLWRGIEAGAYKPNALWFCMIAGIAAITAGFFYQIGKSRSAAITAVVTVAVVLGYYLTVFISKPEDDATFRVGLIILVSIAEIIVVFYPCSPALKEGALTKRVIDDVSQ